MNRTSDASTDSGLLGPLLQDFQLLGDGVDRLLATLSHRPAPAAA